jgi:hypothetical protein
MTDRELLEKAARAAGIVGSWEIDSSSVQGREYFNVPYDNHNMLSGFEWNPLREDGDALRLAVKLGEKFPCFMLGIFNRAAFPHACASVAHGDGEETYVEQDDNADMAETTRRAIVRAAAAIADSTAAKE